MMLMDWVIGLWLAASPAPAFAQKTAAPAMPQAEAAAEPEEAPAEEAQAEEAPVKKKPGKKAAKSAPLDPFKMRLAEISKVHKSQMAFGNTEFEAWRLFWTKLRDERGLFEMRLANERKAFVESLSSLDSKDHAQSLVDYETMQSNKMRSFEESQGVRIKDFVQEREAKLREFGVAQEAERDRMAQASQDAWVEERTMLNIPLPLDKKAAKKEKEREKDKKPEEKKDKKKDKSKEDW